MLGGGGTLNTTLFEQLSPGFSGSGDGLCMTFQYVYSDNSADFQMKFVALRRPCDEKGYFLCQHDARSCEPMELQTIDSSTALAPPLFTVASYVKVVCQPGFFRPSELPQAPPPPAGPAAVGSVPNNFAYCTGTADPSLDPAKFRPRWNYTQIENCRGVSCGVFTGPLYNVLNQIPDSETQAQTTFKFGHTFNVSCARGYVSYTDPSTVTALVQCQQSDRDRSQGIWAPVSNSPCIAVRCNASTLMAMVPRNAMLLSARNKITQRQYDVVMQTSSVPLFNNIVTIQCLDGFFFPDRQFSKQLICDLANDSQIVGQWLGYLGTVLPLSPSCQDSTCTYESILITSGMNVQPFFMMLNSVGAYVNQTEPSGEPYPYQTQLRFFCNTGFSTGTDDTVQNLMCGPQGRWMPNLTPCISIIPPLNTGLAQHYVPPPVEAPSAQEIGYVAIVILVVFLSLIVILDLSTLARDIKLMKNNILNLKAARRRRENKDNEAS